MSQQIEISVDEATKLRDAVQRLDLDADVDTEFEPNESPDAGSPVGGDCVAIKADLDDAITAINEILGDKAGIEAAAENHYSAIFEGKEYIVFPDIVLS